MDKEELEKKMEEWEREVKKRRLSLQLEKIEKLEDAIRGCCYISPPGSTNQHPYIATPSMNPESKKMFNEALEKEIQYRRKIAMKQLGKFNGRNDKCD